MPKIAVDRDRCKGCERCVAACPQHIISMTKEINVKGYFYAHVHDPSRCLGCCMCAVTCPDVALSVGINGTRYNFIDY